jgi:hypothetical protein
MSLVATQEGCSALWQQILGIRAIGAPWVRLFGQAWTPSHTDTIATYAAVELAVGGYSPVSLKGGINWQVSALPNGAQAFWPLVQWSFIAGCTVYGYWLNDASNMYSLVAEAFAAPFSFGAAGGPFQLQLPLTLTSLP